jgi:tight adherence protein C
MQLYLVTLLVFFAVGTLAFLILWLLGRRSDPAVARWRLIGKAKEQRDFDLGLLGDVTVDETKRNPHIEKILSTLSRFARKPDKSTSKLKKLLIQAGYYQENSVNIFQSLEILGAVVFLLLCVSVGFLSNTRIPLVLMAGLLMSVVGYLLPGIILRSKVRRRQEVIAKGLPDALDFMVVCVEAGMGLNAALFRVGKEIRLRNRALGEELILVNQEMRTGASREQALRSLSQRNAVKDLNTLVGALVLADRLGTNIVDTLRAQAESLRTRMSQRIEENAAKASIRMLFPLVFLILPALFIVILGPGLILAVRTLFPGP